MVQDLQEFTKQKDFLVCVDSDGCAMDTMDVKHFECFGPCMVEQWALEPWRDAILTRWNDINLFTMTRGVNRFKGLAMALEEIHASTTPIEGVQELTAWVAGAKELSNDGLQAQLDKAFSPCLAKALRWSRAVNAAIAKLPDRAKKPFLGAAQGLATAHGVADVVVVSSANREAVLEEWKMHGLLEHVDLVMAQDAGSKAHCIAQLLEKGYSPAHVLMVGDAPGDQDAAQRNGVGYYPILVRKEKESWDAFSTALAHVTAETYAPYGAEKLKEFLQNLGA